jgi:hypothetical protein
MGKGISKETLVLNNNEAMKNSRYSISEARQNDLKELEEFFNSTDYALRNKKLLHWKYLGNPAGQARIFLIREEGLKIKGALSFLPRICVKPNSDRFVILQAVDAFLAPEARGQSLYSKLIKYSTSKLGMPIYGFPNKIAERIEVKSGWEILAPINSWYFPINIGHLLSNSKLRFFTPLLNSISKAYAYFWLNRNQINLELRKINEFKNDFVVKWEHLYIERTANFLNWRFINNPIKNFFCYEFHNNGELIGYCVYAIEESTGVIYDFISMKNQRGCLMKIVECLRTKQNTHVVFKCVGMSLRKFGFIKRRLGSNVISYSIPGKCLFLTLCDSDWD